MQSGILLHNAAHQHLSAFATNPGMAKQPDVWGAFVWTAFAFNTLFASLLAILAFFTYSVCWCSYET